MEHSQILRLPDVIKKIGLSRSSIYARIADDEFPKPINLGGRSVGWLSTELTAWVEERKGGRNEK